VFGGTVDSQQSELLTVSINFPHVIYIIKENLKELRFSSLARVWKALLGKGSGGVASDYIHVQKNPVPHGWKLDS
jgi:hypothetical protein